MLSFDYAPQFYSSPFEPRYVSRSSPQSFGLGSDFFTPSRSSYHCQSPRRIVRSRSCHHPFERFQERPRFGQRFRAANGGYDFNDLLNQMIQEHHDDEEDFEVERKPEVGYKVLRSKNQYQIHIHKNNNEYNHYSISYKVIDGFAMIHVESEKDEFKKVFKFKQNDVDVMNVKWELAGNVLKIIIPRVPADEFVVRPQVKKVFAPVRDESRRSVSPSPKPQQIQEQVPKQAAKQPSESKPKARVISIPIDYEDSETETAVTTPRSSRSNSFSETDSISTRSRSNSEAELSSDEHEPLHKLPKLKRRVSIEEVEDESLHL
ncbi:Titin [Wickerhamomyces ciferrii]|uniref:Titin n=1 Tax=Wickerhamomyces ciferrii (strain ATCC 14091 / BCRC 22168 / CBS 111 / JCM 3599 / NBRC 0793 / NRRL Y-1031 F-60-10) TaxID=1206466 RepID=K0KH31_WICCF|nr:Titin [Wickerhamomyces ciferrii]CCH41492.1 Titin [Wickerhamomyces ciferrii]